MINFRKQEERLPSTLILLSFVILLGCLLTMIFVPKTTAAGNVRGRTLTVKRLETELGNAEKQIKSTEQAVRPRLWKGEAEAITTLLLTQMNSLSAPQAVKVVAFRPQRYQVFEGVTELPYTVNLNGSYAGILKVLKTLDAAGTKIVLRSLQIAAASAAKSDVTAVIGISVYHETTKSELANSQKGVKSGKN